MYYSAIKKLQKIMIISIYVLILTVGFFEHFSTSAHFVPTNNVAKFGLYFSIIAAYGFVLTGYYLVYRTQWKMSEKFTKQISSPFQHIFNFIGIAPLIAILIYYTVSGITPYLYTSYFGDTAEKQVIATAVVSNNNKAKCHYELTSKTFNYFFFDYCLTAQQYQQFPPDQNVMVKLSTKQSHLGTIVERFQGIMPESTNQP